MNKSDHFVIISGAGYKSTNNSIPKNIFKDKFTKPNIGATCAFELVQQGYSVLIISKTEEKLIKIKESVDEITPNNLLNFVALDLLDTENVKKISKYIPKNKTVHLVHSMGLSAGNYKLLNDNPYLPIDKTPCDLPSLEFESVVKSLLLLVQTLLPYFNKQKDTRLVVISSMSGIRSYLWGFSHTSAKAGLHNATRALTFEMNKKNIFVSEINPGIVDTGMYDPPKVKEAVLKVAQSFGYEFDYDNFPQMCPTEVAKAVSFCMNADSHVLQINIIPKGQYPNINS